MFCYTPDFDKAMAKATKGTAFGAAQDIER
jgi:hypothetical protein